MRRYWNESWLICFQGTRGLRLQTKFNINGSGWGMQVIEQT